MSTARRSEGNGAAKREPAVRDLTRTRVSGWRLAAVPTAIVAGFFAVDLGADLLAGVSTLHLGLDVVALLVSLLCLGGVLRKR